MWATYLTIESRPDTPSPSPLPTAKGGCSKRRFVSLHLYLEGRDAHHHKARFFQRLYCHFNYLCLFLSMLKATTL